MRTLTRRQWMAATALTLTSPPWALAQTYPARPIRMLVGFAPGGPTDILARTVAPALSKAIGQSVIVDNRAGAGGALAAQQLAKADADGYTIMFAGDGQLALLPQLIKNAGYETLRDIAPIHTVAGQANVLMANKSSGITDLASLVRKAKAEPGRITYGSAGNGTPTHLVGALFETATGVELLHVPYRGAGPAMSDFLGGRLDLMFVGMPVAAQHAGNDKLAVLAVTGDQRATRFPDVPTFAELGVKGLGAETDVWWAVVAPKGTPEPVRARLDQAVRAALTDPQLLQAFATQGVAVVDRDAAATAQRTAQDHARWAQLIKSGKLKVE